LYLFVSFFFHFFFFSNPSGNISTKSVKRITIIILILLRASFSAPRVLHLLLRCSPSKDHPALKMFDSQLRSAVCHITNSRLSDDQWLQASLSVKEGGLGVRRVASLAYPAFLAFAASTLFLQALILAGCCSGCHFLQALSDWSARFGIPPVQLPHNQTWDRPVVASDRAQVQSCLDSFLQLASFLAATACHSGNWLFALPITSCGLKLDDEFEAMVYVLSWTRVSRTFADVARRSTLAVSTALSANRPLVDRPDITS